MKKVLALLLALCMVMALTGCADTSSDSSDEGDTVAETEAAEETEAAAAGTYVIGICQSMPHVALDAAAQGFEDALTEIFGDAVTFDEQNAQGDSATCSTIISSFVSNEIDLILANATDSLQAAASGTDTIPILGTPIIAGEEGICSTALNR